MLPHLDKGDLIIDGGNSCFKDTDLRARNPTGSLGYFDAYRSAWMPANLIQVQRDFFGTHTCERIDAKGTFHIEWEKG